MGRAQAFYESVFLVRLENMTMPTNMDSSMQMLAFPSDMQKFGCSGALVKMDGVNPGG